MYFTRRDFLKRAGKLAFAAGAGGLPFSGCLSKDFGVKDLSETLDGDHYGKLTKDWDPVFGPRLQWFSRYKGLGDFQGHIRGNATPGLDYDVPKGTPLVPMTASYLRQRTKDENGSLYVLLIDIFNPAYRISFGHLEKTLVDEKFHLSGEVMNYLGEGVRPLMRGEIVALSGNSGFGPMEYKGVQPPHLHISLYYLNFKKNKTLAYLDPEKYGLDGGRPVFWDGETVLDGQADKRISRLEHALENFNPELDRWPRTDELFELSGTLREHSHLLGKPDGKKILDSKHFQDLRALLKRTVLEEKRFLPGTRPYSLMMKIVGYSTDETQEIILTLPFVAPGLEKKYSEPIYEKGPFFHLTPTQRSL